MLNPQHTIALAALVNECPFFTMFSMSIVEMGTGYSLLRLDLENKHMSPYGAIQGGVYESVVDAAAYWASYCELPEDAGLITMDVNVHNLVSVRGGTLWARGTRIKVGRSTCLAQADITSENGQLLATGTSKLLVTQGLQTIPQMLAYTPERIPPKFID